MYFFLFPIFFLFLIEASISSPKSLPHTVTWPQRFKYFIIFNKYNNKKSQSLSPKQDFEERLIDGVNFYKTKIFQEENLLDSLMNSIVKTMSQRFQFVKK